MSRRVLVPALMAVVLAVASAGAKLPRDVDEFRERLGKEAAKPEAAAKLFVEAALVYAKDSTRDAGRKMLSLILLDGKWEKSTFFVQALRTKDYIFRSYAEGTSPGNGYAMNPDEFKLVFAGPGEADQARAGGYRLKLKSSGADEPRALGLAKGDDGAYRVAVYADLYKDVKPPRK